MQCVRVHLLLLHRDSVACRYGLAQAHIKVATGLLTCEDERSHNLLHLE